MRLILSTQDAEYRHTEVTFAKPEASAPLIETDKKTYYQTLLGFGGAFTEAAAVTFAKMSETNQKRILEAYFDPKKGLGYVLGRIAIGSSDFSEEMYDYLNGDDATLRSFDISREERAVFPMVRAAMGTSGGKMSLLASPWSPPAFMKDNKERKHGGHLLTEYAMVYAAYLLRFVIEARKSGMPIEWLSVQNETDAIQTWDSCIYSAQQERDFVKNYLGPAIKKALPSGIKLLIHDHNRDILLDRVLPILEDSDAAQHIWGTAIHWYVSEDFSASSKLHEAHPDKHILFTEGCVEGGPAPGNWANAERYARNIIGDLSNYVEGWIEWNLILNKQGGPNHVGNYCCAPILCDTDNDEVIINPSYYAIGHFSKFIRPGAVRMGHKVPDNLPVGALAARNTDGSAVLVLLNETDNDLPLRVFVSGQIAGLTLPAHSIATILS